MKPKIALIIGAVAAAVFGLLLTFASKQMLGGFGLGTPNEGIVLARDVGVTLLGLAVINWLARDATGAALRAVLIGNLVIQALEFIVNGYEVIISQLPGSAAGGLIIHLVLAVIFALALRRAGSQAPA